MNFTKWCLTVSTFHHYTFSILLLVQNIWTKQHNNLYNNSNIMFVHIDCNHNTLYDVQHNRYRHQQHNYSLHMMVLSVKFEWNEKKLCVFLWIDNHKSHIISHNQKSSLQYLVWFPWLLQLHPNIVASNPPQIFFVFLSQVALHPIPIFFFLRVCLYVIFFAFLSCFCNCEWTVCLTFPTLVWKGW